MNRLNLLVASCVVALISGCSFSVKHRGEDGCGESGVYTSHHTCQKCGKKSRRFARTMPLYPGDNYGQWGDPVECGCGDAFGPEFSMELGSGILSGPFMDMSSGCSSCAGPMDSTGMMSGGCGAEGGAMHPSYVTPPAVQQFSPTPAPVAIEKHAHPIPGPVPPAHESPMPMPVPEPEPSPLDQPADVKPPMSDPNPQPYDDAPKEQDFGADSDAAPAAPAAEIPADPVSWEVPQLPR
ncbi:MAG: hypothetical protein ACK58L_06515 [Planctomycetota bacterium]